MALFKKILIANRGEIALRVISACRELGIATVAVYSEADRNSLHTRFADEAVCIGPAASTASYLNIPSVISAAEITNVEAIHPGYGFLAESAYFAEVCETCNIKFIGPPSDLIRLMGDKERARAAMQKAGLPVLPGSGKVKSTSRDLLEVARKVGYPLMIKAAAGGGGRGMRIARDEDELLKCIEAAQMEAESAFGSAEVYLEKYLGSPRHIEFQVLGDQDGNLLHLGERECSIQRRYQKLVEECPSVALSQKRRLEIGTAVVEALKTVHYVNAGTVEFLFDDRGDFYFMEMNTRIQVEHPVTEMVTGLDLIKEQIRIATGEPLTLRQEDVRWEGHAIECRINAESPETFAPSPGKIQFLHFPGGPGIRVDSAAHADDVISPHYDSLIAKLIAHGSNRTEAIRRMARALDTTIIEGVPTSLTLHQKIMRDRDFQEGHLSTEFLERLKSKTVVPIGSVKAS